MTQKFDVKKELVAFYAPKNNDFELIDVPHQRFLGIEGMGAPQSNQFASAIETLYSVAYPLKFISKARSGFDYVVGPLEAQWWAEDYSAFNRDDRSAWKWRLLTAIPESVSDEDLMNAMNKATSKGSSHASQTHFYELSEGLSFQMLYIGPFSNEGPVLEKLHSRVMPESGMIFNGHHHEIYLSDMRKTEASKLKTILRQPVKQSQ
ncbi:GyrI-like domain-containing protein [Aurantimicrobium minutum]|uniref:GyrI-like domain-containing protein n=1 Tax=Aurantimicrobium minutum TaxID=708131 RepID=UPI0024761A24|nr:GyrI-like domain-containing protein [Aurantimicrobium minutum]MDH6422630.1 hypothetical protein [Aurantimicrobium minutum]